MLNHVVLMGRLTRDPELRRTPAGDAVCTVRIAVDRDFKSKSGEKITDFVDVVCWRNTAEFVANFFAKGRMMAVDGKLQVRKYVNREDIRQIRYEVIADSVYFADSRHDMPHQTAADLPLMDDEDELPFA